MHHTTYLDFTISLVPLVTRRFQNFDDCQMTTMTSASTATQKKPLPIRRYLVARHGETDFNKARRVQGTLDTPRLTLEGISQAAALGAWAAGRQAQGTRPAAGGSNGHLGAPRITRTWCSPMMRCRQTYAAVAGCCSSHGRRGRALPDPIIHPGLHEIALREWQGRLRQEIIEQDPVRWNMFKADPKQLRLDNGRFAPVVDCWERAQENWSAIRSDAAAAQVMAATDNDSDLVNPRKEGEDERGVVFIMCHGAIGQCMLLHALGMDIDMYGKSRRYAFDNCECVEIEWADGEERSTRWRRVHPEETEWLSTSASHRMDSGGLISDR